MLVCSVAVYALQFIRSLQTVGDKLDWVFRIFPPYLVVDAVFFDSSGQTLADYRNRQPGMKGTINPDPYYWKNNTFDFMLAGFHFVLWTLILIAIESGWSCNCLKRIQNVGFP